MSCEPFNTTAFTLGLQRLPAHWLRHHPPRSVSHAQDAAAYRGLKPWGRTRFVVSRGQLVYAAAPSGGCVLRRTPILAWALLQTLRRDPTLPDVSLPFNCRDKPTYWYPDGPQPRGSYEKATSALPADGRPALVFSYTTGHTFSDVPLPDATFWGLPYARIPPWGAWLRGGGVAWEAKREQMLWVGTAGVSNGKLGFSSHPLRGRFARCAPAAVGGRLRLRGVAKEALDRLAWKCRPGECDDWQPEGWMALEEQCAYRVIVHLPGVSDWLEHFKHQLSCGSLNVFVTEQKEADRRDVRREREVTDPLAPPLFEHFDWWSPLLRAGVHYVHVSVKLQRGRRDGKEVCDALQRALAELDATPGRARCIAERGRELARSLTMERVYEYMSSVLRGAAAVQKREVTQRLRGASHRAELNVVTEANFLNYTSPSTRPWIERIFLPSHGVKVNGATHTHAPRGNRATFSRL
ncbi:hypothetical protein AB1Y20_005486 [Prymnesium parvum]|uniref:Glycosyl transferase CAP10 domain-containing protein n=1 Tax=Prymnesium parvum TaxID=97485 RepID=A0AB34J4A1_PRYPA